jgi:CubicO group peptidase (beta-lactamase class C family)
VRTTVALLALGVAFAAHPAQAQHGAQNAQLSGVRHAIGEAAQAAIADASSLPRLWAVVAAHRGRTIVERRFRGPSLDTAVNVKSVSKSIVSALVGIAIAEGHLEGVDQPIGSFFERDLRGEDDPRKRDITIGDLLSMRSGLARTSGAHYGAFAGSANWVRHVLTRPLLFPPGTQMLYSTGNTHLLSAILTKATGKSTHHYAQQKLGAPLGIHIPPWPRDPQGIFVGGNQMRLPPRALLRIGELYRNLGVHEGREVVTKAWVRASLEPRTRSPFSGERYGYGWFISEVRGRRLVYAWGYGGQFIFVLPELELTVVTTSSPGGPRDFEHLAGIFAGVLEPLVDLFTGAAAG